MLTRGARSVNVDDIFAIFFCLISHFVINLYAGGIIIIIMIIMIFTYILSTFNKHTTVAHI